MDKPPRTAVYAGSFDPVTLGHEDVIARAASMFDHLIVAIGVNSAKKPLFTTEERLAMLQEVARKYPNVRVMSFDGLLVKFCENQGASVIVRGLRAITDFESELGIAHVNATMSSKVETVFLPTRPEFSFVSSSTAREVAFHKGLLRPYVNENVLVKLRHRFADASEK